MKLIAITGGIGAGKSVVAEIVRALGYPVYDCDISARCIMDNDEGIRRRLTCEISPLAIDDEGRVDRRAISEVVFNDRAKLDCLNGIVHGAVREDLQAWDDAQDGQLAFVETAILVESGLDKMVDEVWIVDAPRELRIERVMRRNNFIRAQVEARISSQTALIAEGATIITNDDAHSVIIQVDNAIAALL